METPSLVWRRKLLIVLVVVEIVVFSVVTLVFAPGILDPITSVPPNRYFALTTPMEIACFAWGYKGFILSVLVAGLVACWFTRGKPAERAFTPLCILMTLVFVATLVLGGYILSLPGWVGDHYGPEARANIFRR